MNSDADRYEWDWFDERNWPTHDDSGLSGLPYPHRGAYGVRRGGTVVCLTSRNKDGYDQALAIADALNAREGRVSRDG